MGFESQFSFMLPSHASLSFFPGIIIIPLGVKNKFGQSLAIQQGNGIALFNLSSLFRAFFINSGFFNTDL